MGTDDFFLPRKHTSFSAPEIVQYLATASMGHALHDLNGHPSNCASTWPKMLDFRDGTDV